MQARCCLKHPYKQSVPLRKLPAAQHTPCRAIDFPINLLISFLTFHTNKPGFSQNSASTLILLLPSLLIQAVCAAQKYAPPPSSPSSPPSSYPSSSSYSCPCRAAPATSHLRDADMRSNASPSNTRASVREVVEWQTDPAQAAPPSPSPPYPSPPPSLRFSLSPQWQPNLITSSLVCPHDSSACHNWR